MATPKDILTVEVHGLQDQRVMLNHIKNKLSNTKSVLELYRDMAVAIIQENISTSTRTTDNGGRTRMRRLSKDSTLPLRMMGIARVGDAARAPAGTTPLLATGDYRNSWANMKNDFVSVNANSMSGALLTLINNNIKAVNEADRFIGSRLFYNKFVPARPVTNIFNNEVMSDMVEALFRHILSDLPEGWTM